MTNGDGDGDIRVLQNDIEHIKEVVDDLKVEVKEVNNKLESDYITRREFEVELRPLRVFFWGLVSLMTLGVLSAVVYYIIKELLK